MKRIIVKNNDRVRNFTMSFLVFFRKLYSIRNKDYVVEGY